MMKTRIIEFQDNNNNVVFQPQHETTVTTGVFRKKTTGSWVPYYRFYTIHGGGTPVEFKTLEGARKFLNRPKNIIHDAHDETTQ